MEGTKAKGGHEIDYRDMKSDYSPTPSALQHYPPPLPYRKELPVLSMTCSFSFVSLHIPFLSGMTFSSLPPWLLFLLQDLIQVPAILQSFPLSPHWLHVSSHWLNGLIMYLGL